MIVITLIIALGALAFATTTGAMFGPPDRSEYFARAVEIARLPPSSL